MSQYPSPSQYPQQTPGPAMPTGPYPPGFVPPARDPLIYARRASILMWSLAALCVLGGVCTATLVAPMVRDQLQNVPGPQGDAFRQQAQEFEAQTGMAFASIYIVFGVAVCVAGAVMALLAFFVYRGGSGAVIGSAVYTGILLAVSALVVIGGLGQVSRAGAQGLLGLCIILVPVGLLILLMVWLVQAARAAPAVAYMKHWQNQQLAWSQQQYQAYGAQQQQPQYPTGTAAPTQQYTPPPTSGSGYGYPQRPDQADRSQGGPDDADPTQR